MDKKLLVSLMMTTPVAAFAQQAQWVAAGGNLDWTINPAAENWTPDAMSNLKLENGLLSCPVSAGFVTHNVTLPTGSYAVTYNCQNALLKINNELQVVRNDQKQPIDKDNKVTDDYSKMIPLHEKVVVDGGSVTLEFTPIDKTKTFFVGEVKLALQYDFTSAWNDIQAAFNKVDALVVINPADEREQAEDLKVEYEDLDVEGAGIQADIAAIADNLDNGPELAAAYTEYNLWEYKGEKNAKDLISLHIVDYKTAVIKYNTRAKAENDIYANIVKNTAHLNGFQKKILDLRSSLTKKMVDLGNELLPEDKDIEEYCKFITAKDVAAAQSAIDSYEAAVTAEYDNLEDTVTAETFASLTKKAADIQAQINAITYAQAAADWNAYTTFLTDRNAVQASYVKYFALINNIDVQLDGANVYADKIGEYNTKLAEILNNNTGYAISEADAYNTNGSRNTQNANISGAAGKLAGVKTVMKDREAGFDKVYKELVALQTAQDAQWSIAKNKISDLRSELKKKQDITLLKAFEDLSTTDQETVNNDIASIKAAIDNLENWAKDQYKAHKLDTTGKDYDANIQAVSDQNAKYNKDTAKFSGVLELMTSLNNAKAYVDNQTAQKEIKGYKLSSKFEKSFTNISNAINSYYKSTDKSTSAKEDIENAITGVNAACDTLVTSFKKAVEYINGAQKAVDNFNAAIKAKSKNVVIINGKPVYDTATFVYDYVGADGEPNPLTVSEVQDNINEYSAQLDLIATGGDKQYENPQNAYEAANKVSAIVVADNYQYYVPKAQSDFEVAVTKANLEAVQNMSNNIDEWTRKKNEDGTDNPYATAEGMQDAVEGGLTPVLPKDYNGPVDAEKAAEAVDAAGRDVKKLAECDKNLQVLADAYVKVYDKVKEVVANYDKYVELKGKLAVVQTKLDTFKASIDKTTIEPAVTYYKKKVTEIQEGDKNNPEEVSINDVKDAIQTSYENQEEVDYASTYLANIKTLTDKIAKTEKDCKANNDAYIKQMAMAQDVADYANLKISELTDIDKVDSNLQLYLDKIGEVTTELANLNVELTKSFANGKSADLDDNYVAQFEQMKKKIDGIVAEEDTNYLEAVKNANNRYLGTKNLGDNQLDNQYNAAINEVNAYRYQISNPGYYTKLIADPIFQKNHEDLQKCYQQIAELNTQISKFKAGLTPGKDRDKWVVIEDVLQTQSDVTSNGIKLSKLTADASKIATAISTTLNAVNDAALEVANPYYTAQFAKAQNIYNNIRSRLYNAGFSDDETVDGKVIPGELSTATNTETVALQAANDAYDAYQKNITENKPNAVYNFILGMSGIADNLDKITELNANTFVDNAIKNQWTDDYNAAVSTIKGYIADLAKYPNANNVDGKDGKRTSLTNNLKAVENLNKTWGDLKTAEERERRFNPDFNQRLETILSQAKVTIDDAKTEHNNAVKNNAARDELINNPNSQLNLTQAQLDALLAWSGYRQDQLATIGGLQSVINTVVSDIDADASINVQTYITRFGNIRLTITAAYKTVFKDELTYAQSLVPLARSAFNNAKVNGLDADSLKDFDKQIRTLADNLDVLSKAADKADFNSKKDDLRGQLLGYEEELCGLINTLEEFARNNSGSVNTNTWVATVEDLNKEYDVYSDKFRILKSKIEKEGAVTGDFGAAVSAEFAPQVQALIDQLNALYGEYTTAENIVIAEADKYSYEMKQLNGKAAKVEEDWKPKQKKAELKFDCNNKYNVSIKQLDGYMAYADNAKTQAEKYDSPQDQAMYNAIDYAINGTPDDKDPNKRNGGELDRLDTALKNLDLNKLGVENADEISENVNEYVRTTLNRAASAAENQQYQATQVVINNIKNPGTTEDGKWSIKYVNAWDLKERLEIEAKNIKDLDEKNKNIEVYSYIDKNGKPQSKETDAAKAFAAYDDIMAELQGYVNNVEEITKEAEEAKFIKGDINRDQKVNIFDVQKLISIIGEGVDLDTPAKQQSADVNNDDEVNIADVTTLINWILRGGSTGRSQISAFLGAQNGDNSVRVEEVMGENGLRRFAVVLSNEVDFAAGQLDIVLPSHARVAGVTLGERACELESYVFEGTETTRVVMTSLENALIQGNNGCVLFIDVEGNAEVSVDNVIFSDINGHAYNLSKNVSTGVNGIYDSIKNGVKAIYNAAGQQLNRLTKGVNIIRNEDGSVTKKINK